MIDRNDLAKLISTDWDELNDPSTLGKYVPWIANMVYPRLKGANRNEDHLSDIVHLVVLELLEGISNKKFHKDQGHSFRGIIVNKCIYRTKDHFIRLKNEKVIYENSLQSSEENGFDLSAVHDARTEESENEEFNIAICYEAFIPFILLSEQLLSSMNKKDEPKARMKMAKKLITVTLLPTLLYLDFSKAKTSTGDESAVQYSPKVLMDIMGFSSDFKRDNLDNIKSRMIPNKLRKNEKMIKGDNILKINSRVIQFREHLNKNLSVDDLLKIHGVTDFDGIKTAEDLPEDYLIFFHKFLPKGIVQDLISWSKFYRSELEKICDNDLSRYKKIIGME